MAEETEVVKNEVTEDTTTAVEPDPVVTDQVDTNSLQARINELAEDNRRQKALVDQLMIAGMNQNSRVQEQPEDEIDPAVAKRLAKMQAQTTQQFQGMYGGLLEEMDKTAMMSGPLAPVYKEHEQEVENLRRQSVNEGRYFKREEALAQVMLRKGLLAIKKKTSTTTVVKQTDVNPGGVTNKADRPSNLIEEKPKTLKEKLAGIKF